MSDLQRYSALVTSEGKARMYPTPDGQYVLAYDAEQATAAARRHAMSDTTAAVHRAAEIGQQHMLTRCLDDLETRAQRERAENDPDGILTGLQYAIDCLRKLKEEQ